MRVVMAEADTRPDRRFSPATDVVPSAVRLVELPVVRALVVVTPALSALVVTEAVRLVLVSPGWVVQASEL
nr:hypothetical protein [Luteipulveratus halotolerans]